MCVPSTLIDENFYEELKKYRFDSQPDLWGKQQLVKFQLMILCNNGIKPDIHFKERLDYTELADFDDPARILHWLICNSPTPFRLLYKLHVGLMNNSLNLTDPTDEMKDDPQYKKMKKIGSWLGSNKLYRWNYKVDKGDLDSAAYQRDFDPSSILMEQNAGFSKAQLTFQQKELESFRNRQAKKVIDTSLAIKYMGNVPTGKNFLCLSTLDLLRNKAQTQQGLPLFLGENAKNLMSKLTNGTVNFTWCSYRG